MRRLPLITPPTGWPEFITELVIVVLGVFLALAAQEAVNNWNARNDLAEFRKAVDQEIAENLSAYELRAAVSPCVNARLEELAAWQKDWRGGSGPPMTGRIRRPIGYTLSQDVWNSGAEANLREMPLKQRLNYASLYAGFQTYENLRLREAAAWQSLYAYDEARSLTTPEVNALRGFLLTARALAWSIDSNWVDLKRQAAAMGIAPARHPLDDSARGVCTPIAFTRKLQDSAAP